jgi:hypothetical protein
MDPRDWRFPTACPVCNSVAAVPCKATTTEANALELCIRCPHCAHEWVWTAQSPPIVIKPKEDRRESGRQLLRS